MSSPTSAELEDMAKILLRRADDLHAVGTTLSSRAGSAVWQCDKAERFRAAIAARQTESHRLAVQLRDLGRYLRLLGQQAAAQAQQGG
jgi:hypothetical protein